MIYFGACPKCQGDLTLNRDGYGSFFSCLQCGLMHDVDSKPAAVARRKPMVPAWLTDEEPLAKAA